MNTQETNTDRKLFRAFLNAVPACQQRMADTDWFPAVDVTETSQGYLFECDLPGLTRREIQTRVDGKVLWLAGVRTTLRHGGEALRVERPAGEFVRRLVLPPDACAAEIRVTLQDGVLHLHLPKQKQPDENQAARTAPVENQVYQPTPS